MKLIFSGIVIPISTIDWYGRSVSVIFFNGCNFRCVYCSNFDFISLSEKLEPFIREKKAKTRNELLFNWNNIPGNDSEKFIEYLIQNYNIDWVKNAIIEKIDEGKIIKVSNKNRHLFLRFSENKETKAILTIDDGRTCKLDFKNEIGKLNIYGKNKLVLNPLEPLFKKQNIVDIEEIEKQILDAKSFISAVVFSGGEPTTQYEALEHLARFAKEQGLLVGIETNGYYPERLAKLIEKKLLDKIFLDIKAPLDDAQKYSIITRGGDDAARRARKSLELENVEIEVRTTVFRPFSDVLGIARDLEGKNCTYVIQQGIPENAPEGEIRKETAFTRDEMVALARSISFLKDVRIRTKEKGEERVN